MDVDDKILLFVPKLNFKIHIICIVMDENAKWIKSCILLVPSA
jgi:hypothetical protein